MAHPISFPSRRGFTLVEILVVVAIVALLAAVLLPAFGRARAAGRRTTCASNLKQIGLAMEQYAQDNRVYPGMQNYADQNLSYCSIWANKIFPYVKSPTIFQCPSFPTGLYRSDCPVPPDANAQSIKYRGSYDINLPNAAFIASESETDAYKMTTPSSKRNRFSPIHYTRPSSTILVLDGNGYFVSPGYQEPAATDTAILQHYGVDAHHEGGLNAAFADGHVKYLSLEALLRRSLWQLNGPE